MCSLLRGFIAAFVIWISGCFAVVAQTLPDGMIVGDDRMRSFFAQVLTGRNNGDLLSILRRQVVCVKDGNFARFLNARGVRTQMVTARSAPTAVRSGQCDLLIEGAAAIMVQLILAEVRPDPPETQPEPEPPTSTDREGPNIRPTGTEFTASATPVTITADITDSSGVARADVNNVAMGRGQGDRFAVRLRLANDYKRRDVTITAYDRPGNPSSRRVTVRRVPACGPSDGLDLALARVIQSDLNALGFSAGSVDGLIGRGSCGAIERFRGGDPFSWPELRDALGRARIGIVAQVQAGQTDAQQTVHVSIADPRNTGAVNWIRVTANGAQTEPDRRYRGVDLRYQFQLGADQTLALRFEALDGRTRPLAETRATLRRLPEMSLTLSATGLTGGRIETTDENARVSVALRNPSPDAIVAWQRAETGLSEQRPYAGRGVTFDIPMPEPGKTSSAHFLALDRTGAIRDREMLTLVRPADMQVRVYVNGIETSEVRSTSPSAALFVDLLHAWPGAEVSLVDEAGNGARWAYEGRQRSVVLDMPQPGQKLTAIARALDRFGKERDVQMITLSRPPWMRLDLSGQGLEAGQITTTDDGVTLRASVAEPWPGAVLLWRGGIGPGGERNISDAPLDLRLPAPQPGDSGQITFELQDRAGVQHALQEVTIARRSDMTLNLSADGLAEGHIETTAETVTIEARVSNHWPGSEIRMEAGSDRRTMSYDGTPARFVVAMPPPGGRARADFTVLDKHGVQRQRESVTLSRAPLMALVLSGSDLADGMVHSAKPGVTISAEVRNLWPGAMVGYRVSDGAGEMRDYGSAPVAFDLQMPPPDGEKIVSFFVLGRDQVAHDTVELTLARNAVTLTVSPAPQLETDEPEGALTVDLQGAGTDARVEIVDENNALLVDASYIPTERWMRTVAMPARGETRVVVVRAVGPDANVLATQRITLVRPAPAVPVWLVPGAVGLLLLGSAVWPIGRARKLLKPGEKPAHKPVVPPRVYAVADPTPKTDVEPEQMPVITLRIEPSSTTEITIITEEESDERS